jgi:hypothetical protein
MTPEVLFINPDFAKRFSHLNGSVEESYMNSHVMLAQDKHVLAYLGSNLMAKLKADIVANTLAGDYLTLMDDYVRKVTLWWTMVEMIPNLHVKIMNGGLVIRTADNAVPITKEDLNRQMDLARQNAHHYTALMIRFLCDNNLPEYLDAGHVKPEKKVYSVSGYEIGGSDYKNRRFGDRRYLDYIL